MSGTLRDLGREMAALQDEALAERQSPAFEQRLARVHAELGRRGVARPASKTRILAAVAIAAVAASLLAVFALDRPEPLSALARGQALAPGAWLSSDAEQVPVGFSDGTTLTLAPDSRARLVRLDVHGAEIALERGRVTADVVRRNGARWVVAAGPFLIHVTGTRFDASWQPERELLRVTMQEGSVKVSGGCLTEARALSAGDDSEFTCVKSAEVNTGTSPPRVTAPTAESAQGATRVAPTPPADVGAPPVPSAAPAEARLPELGWRELARDGRFKDALVAAEASGFSGLCASATAADVLELGNVARLAGNPARAAEAYLAARQRFAGSGAAATAAFQLGRLAFDGARDYASARRWFSAYLAEQPGGGVAREALGRLMEAEHRSGDVAAARASAERYLARFPGGAHAALAQSLIAE